MSTRSHTGTRGYGFAYFAWMRGATGYRSEAAKSGLTFFMLFNSLNGRLPDAFKSLESDEQQVQP